MTIVAAMAISGLAVATPAARQSSEIAGRLLFAGAGVPHATVTASRSVDAGRVERDLTVTTLSFDDGSFRLTNLADGAWTVRVEMRGFAIVERQVTLPLREPPLVVTLKMRPYAEIVAPRPSGDATMVPGPPAAVPVPSAPSPDDPDIINGTVTNGAATPFAQSRAAGNNRPRLARLYSGTATTALTNSAWNARPYSFGGSVRPANAGDLQLGFTLRGPLRVPWLVAKGPIMTLGLQHGVAGRSTTQSAVMPTAGERLGDFSQSTMAIQDPASGLPFSRNVIPRDRIAPQAAALLAYYPLPNTSTSSGANFQRSLVTTTREDAGRFQTVVAPSRRDRISVDVAARRTGTDAVDLFDFTTERRQALVDAGVALTHSVSSRLQVTARYQFARAAASVTPFFADRVNVSGDAGISGNEQSAVNWGPPTLLFPTIADLRDVPYQRSTTMTHAFIATTNWRRGRHNVSAGGDVRPTSFDLSSQPDPRGTVSFTGAATGDALADFLLGLPSTSAIAFSNTGLRLRGASASAFVVDDIRVAPGITVNAGLRWEYEAPFTEISDTLVNLDVAPGFTAVNQVTPGSPTGQLTGHTYPRSLLRPDATGILPRLAASWRPILGSTFVVRAGYGIYRNSGSYQAIARLLAQQPPFSRTFSVQSEAEAPLTLANPFPLSLAANSNTFAIDPYFQAASVHSWQVTAQRELPASMTISGGYYGNHGIDLMQAFLPNTYPAGAVNPCPACPSGFVYVTSTGTSNRQAAQLSIRRRLRNGLMTGLQYTLANATDDAATFDGRSITPAALAIAQDWRNLAAERGPSSFDQRQLVSVEVQYSTGAGLTGGSLVESVRGSFVKGWTFDAQLTVGSGLPFTPVIFGAVEGTGFVGVRPRLTGVSPAPTTSGAYANPDAYATPLPGMWGDAGRNSIRGPSQFALDMRVSRSFQLPRRLRLDWHVSVTNVLNRVTFSTINTTVSSPQFGRPTAANAMRRVQAGVLFGF